MRICSACRIVAVAWVAWALAPAAWAQGLVQQAERVVAGLRDGERMASLRALSIVTEERNSDGSPVSRTFAELAGEAFFTEMEHGVFVPSESELSFSLSATDPESVVKSSFAISARGGYVIGFFSEVRDGEARLPGVFVNLKNPANEGAGVRLLNAWFGTQHQRIRDFTSFTRFDAATIAAMRRQVAAVAAAAARPELLVAPRLTAVEIDGLKRLCAGMEAFLSELEAALAERFFFDLDSSSVGLARGAAGKPVLAAEITVLDRNGELRGKLGLLHGSGSDRLTGAFDFNLQHPHPQRLLLPLLGATVGTPLSSVRDFEARMGSLALDPALDRATVAFRGLRAGEGFDRDEAIAGVALLDAVFSSPLASLAKAGKLDLSESKLSLGMHASGRPSLEVSLATD